MTTGFKTDLLRELTGLVWTVEDFVVEDGEVEGEPEPDGVGGLHLTLADIKCVLKTSELMPWIRLWCIQ